MSLGRYLVRRVLLALLLVFFVSSGTLLLTRLAPGEVGPDIDLKVDAATRARIRAELGLDRPFGGQYLDWLAGAGSCCAARCDGAGHPIRHLHGCALVRSRARIRTRRVAVAVVSAAAARL